MLTRQRVNGLLSSFLDLRFRASDGLGLYVPPIGQTGYLLAFFIHRLTGIIGRTGIGANDVVRKVSQPPNLAPGIIEVIIIANKIHEIRSMSTSFFSLLFTSFF